MGKSPDQPSRGSGRSGHDAEMDMLGSNRTAALLGLIGLLGCSSQERSTLLVPELPEDIARLALIVELEGEMVSALPLLQIEGSRLTIEGKWSLALDVNRSVGVEPALPEAWMSWSAGTSDSDR